MTGTPASIGVGFVGCGHLTAARHLPALAAVAGAIPIAFADDDRARLVELGEHYRDAAFYPDAHELLADRRIDAVAVCLPGETYSEGVVAALESEVPVLVEMPATAAIEEAEAVVRRAEHTGTPALVGFHLRWHRLARKAARALRQGDLGELELVRAITPRPTLEAAMHHYDLWRYLTGAEVEEVSVLSRSALGDDDVVTISARLSSGALVSAVFREGAGSAHGITLFGSEGSVNVSLPRFAGLEQPRAARASRALSRLRTRRSGDDLASYRAQWEHFLDVVRTGSSPECTLADGVEARRIALAAAESGTTGRPVVVGEAPRTIPAHVQ
jgi:myo-inositol 2-dehydrogenase/D-chiro-inositol 1-dehydrogenase